MYLCPAGRLANLILVFLEDLSGDGLFDILRVGAGSASGQNVFHQSSSSEAHSQFSYRWNSIGWAWSVSCPSLSIYATEAS